MVHAGKLHVFHVDRRAYSNTCGERYVKRFECVGLRHFWSQDWIALKWVWSCWKAVGGGGVTVRGENCCVINIGGYGCFWGNWKVRGVDETLERSENTALGNTVMNRG
jgi:hypothetical protein